jgi:putative ABC transport system permease protein
VISPGNFLDWKARSEAFEELAAFEQFRTVMVDGERSEQLLVQNVSANFFRMLGAQPWRGRLFTEAEDRSSAHSDSLLVISYRLWQNWFGGDPGVIGRRVLINSVPRTIIAVMPREFYFRNREVDLWAPAGLDPAIAYRKISGRYMLAAGRLKPNVGLSQAQTQMTVIASGLEKEDPTFNKNWTVSLEPLRESLVENVRTSLLLLLAAVVLLLAVACSNVANLLLARHSSRRAELAVRIALGAGRRRLMRQLLTESLLLALVAGAAGILMGRLALTGLIRLAPMTINETVNIHIDWRIVLFALGLSTITGVVFGLLPALVASKADVAPELKRATRWGSTGGRSLRAWLIAGEVAASVVLLAGASLLFRSLVKLQHVDSGLNAVNLLTFRFNLPAVRYRGPAKAPRLFAEAIRRIEQLPGVRSASAISHLPFDGMSPGTYVGIGGRPTPKPGEELLANIRTVAPRYFETAGIPIRRGRDFAPEDNTPESPIRFLVNEAFVRKYLSGEEPLGKRINALMDSTNPFGEIVGVVGDVREGSLDKEPAPTVYYVHSHLVYMGMTLMIRTNGNPLGIVAPVRRIMHDLDPAVPVADVRTMEMILGETYARERFSVVLLIGFSASALLLAAIGIYGVLAYSVVERTREIGVRLAVGADPWRVVTMILSDGAQFVAAGTVAGLVIAFAASKYVAALLFEIGPRDPVTFVLAPGVLLIVAFIAAWVPARRASRLDPMKALRVE